MNLGEKVGRYGNFGEMTPQRKDLNTLATAAGSGIMASTKAIYNQRVEGGGEGGGAGGAHLTEQGAHRTNSTLGKTGGIAANVGSTAKLIGTLPHNSYYPASGAGAFSNTQTNAGYVGGKTLQGGRNARHEFR